MKRSRRVVLALTAAVAAIAAIAVDRAAEDDSGSAESLRLPFTMDRVWYRTGRKKVLGGAKLSGDLTVTAESIELVGRKKTLSIPMRTIRVASFGKMRGDVNTDWVVLAVERGGEEELIGFRDGRRMGYGERTREVYELVKRTLRQLGAAQYDVPRGFESYDELDHQFTMAIPAGWASSHHSVVEVDERAVWGTIVFSAEEIPLGSREPERKRRSLETIESGDTSALLVDRSKAGGGMSCSRISASATDRIRDRVASFELIPRGESWVLDGLDVTRRPLAGCEGLQLLGRGRRGDGAAVVLDARAVSDGETVYLFMLRSVADEYDARLRAVDRLLSTFRISVASRAP